MKKLYLLLLVFLLLFIPVTNAVTPYQLDHPIRELNNHTLREVFENRNMGMPYLDGKTDLGNGVYRYYNMNGITLDYNIYNGNYNINGTTTASSGAILFNIMSNTQYTISYISVSGSITGGAIYFYITSPTIILIEQVNQNINKQNTFITTTQTTFRIDISVGRTFENYTFKLQLEKGSTATPYQVPTDGPYSDIDVGEFNLTIEQMDMYYDYYLKAVQFEIDYYEAGQDPGEYQHIFKSILNGVKNLISEMGYVWQWLNAPIITSDMQDYSFNIDWSWDLIGVIRQIMNSAGILTLQIAFWVPSLAFAFMGIPIQISVLSLLFSNLIFLLLGWILVKSLLI